MIEWLVDNWLKIVIPLLAFLATYVVGLWLRGVVNNAFERWTARTQWKGSRLVAATVRRPFLSWVLLLGVAIAVQVSVLPAEAKSITAKVIGSLFILSLGWVITVLSGRLLKLYLPRIKATEATTALAINIVRITIIVVTIKSCSTCAISC